MAKTYEMHMFKTASKKLGLDQAVLSGSRPQKKLDAAPTKAEVRCGAVRWRRDRKRKGEGGGATYIEFVETLLCCGDVDSGSESCLVWNSRVEEGRNWRNCRSPEVIIFVFFAVVFVCGGKKKKEREREANRCVPTTRTPVFWWFFCLLPEKVASGVHRRRRRRVWPPCTCCAPSVPPCVVCWGQVEMLLKHGAYDVFQEGKDGQEAGKKFCEDDIESILSRAKVLFLATRHTRT